jgi:beta-lactamase superfamily II metal-dependent hydrolase
MFDQGTLRRNFIIWVCMTIVCVPSLIFAVDKDELVVNVLSVGHGDAIFIEFPNGTTMLVDGGTESFGDVVVDYIRESGYTSVDYLVLTHDHDDHVGGLVAVLDHFPVGEFLTSEYNIETPLLREVMYKVERTDISVIWLVRGDEFGIGAVNVVILNPPAGSTPEELGGSNGASIVMRLEYGITSVLLAADVEVNRDREMVSVFGDKLISMVLKCAHHGSERSNSEEFLSAVNPLVGIVSTGLSQYGYPSEVTMERIEKLVPDVYRTDQDGHVVVIMDGENVRVETR